MITPTEDGAPRRVALGTPGLSPKSGIMAVGAWLAERGIHAPSDRSWRVQIDLTDAQHARVFAEAIDTRFQITIHPDHWGYCFAHAGRVSRIRVTDAAHVEGRDDHLIAGATPPLRKIGTLIRELEQRNGIFFLRYHATIASTLPGSEPFIRAWVTAL